MVRIDGADKSGPPQGAVQATFLKHGSHLWSYLVELSGAMAHKGGTWSEVKVRTKSGHL